MDWDGGARQGGGLGPTMEGPLHFRTTKLLFSSWRPAHFLLRAGVLYQFWCSGDRLPHTMLDVTSCSACTYTTQYNKPHAFQVSLTHSRSAALKPFNSMCCLYFITSTNSRTHVLIIFTDDDWNAFDGKCRIIFTDDDWNAFNGKWRIFRLFQQPIGNSAFKFVYVQNLLFKYVNCV